MQDRQGRLPPYGGLTLSKQKNHHMLFLWAPHLPRDPNYIEPSQLKEAIHLLPKIGPVPSPGDDDYVPQDSMCKAIVEAAEAAGYSVSADDPALKIHRGN